MRDLPSEKAEPKDLPFAHLAGSGHRSPRSTSTRKCLDLGGQGPAAKESDVVLEWPRVERGHREERAPDLLRATGEVRAVEHIRHRSLQARDANLDPGSLQSLDPALTSVLREERGTRADRDEPTPLEGGRLRLGPRDEGQPLEDALSVSVGLEGRVVGHGRVRSHARGEGDEVGRGSDPAACWVETDEHPPLDPCDAPLPAPAGQMRVHSCIRSAATTEDHRELLSREEAVAGQECFGPHGIQSP